MANLTVEEVSGGLETPVTPSDSVFKIAETIQAETDKNMNIENADTLHKSEAFVEAAKNTNFVVEAFRATDKAYGDSHFDVDKNFAIDDEMAIQYLATNKLPMQYFGDVRNAKSKAHLDFITPRLKERIATDDMIQETIGEGAQMAAGVTGAVIDIDVVAGMGMGAVLKSTSVAKIVMAEGSLEVGLGTARQFIKDDYTAGDMVFDVAVGTGLAAGGTLAVRAYDRPTIKRDAENADIRTRKTESRTRQGVAEAEAEVRPVEAGETPPPPITRINDNVYVANNTITYKIPAAAHGKRTLTDTIITHRTAGHGFHPNDTRLTQKGLGAHYTITKDGKIHQVNDDADKMWHAGGKYNGRSIGIEVTGKFDPKTQTWEKVTKAQKASLTALSRKLGKKYGLSAKDVKYHAEVAAKSANEGKKVKIYVQQALGESDEVANARLAKAQTAMDNAKNPQQKAKATRDYDDTVVANGRRKDRLEEVEYANARDTQLRPTRTPTYAKNRSNFFEKQRNMDIDASLKRIDDLEAQGRTPKNDVEAAKTQKQIDKEMDRLYEESFNSPKMKLMRVVDEMDGDVNNMRFEVENVRQAIGDDDFFEAIESIRKTNPNEIDAIEEMLTTPASKEGLEAFVKSMKESDVSTKVATGVALLLGGSSLHAGDGESNADYITGAFLAIAATIVLGGSTLRALKGNRGLKKLMTNVKVGWADSAKRAEQVTSPEEGQLRRMGATIAESAHTRFTSAIAPFIKAGGKAEKIANDLLYSARDGAGAEIDKAGWVHSTMARYDDLESASFKMWKAENGIGNFDGFLDESATIGRFREHITDATELLETNPKAFADLPESVKKAAKGFDELKKQIYDRATEYEVFGFVDRVGKDGKGTIKGVSHVEGKVPRYWNSSRMNELINSADDVESTIAGLKQSLGQAFYKSMNDLEAAQRVADRFVDDWASGSNFNVSGVQRRGDDVFEAIEGLLKDDVGIEDLSEALAIKKDRVARAKERIVLDPKDIEPVSIKIDGEDFIFDRTILMERNSKAILDKTANTLYGHAALAKRGYKTVKSLDDAIKDATKNVKGGATLRNELEQVSDLVLGIPIPSNNKFMHEISMTMKDLTIASKLVLVTLSMPPELIATITTSTLGRGLRSFTRAVQGKYRNGKDSNMIQMLSMSGLGTSYKRLDFSGFRGYGDVSGDLDDVGAIGKIRDKTMKLRDLSLVLNGLSTFSDGLQRMGMELHLEKIASFVNKGDEGTTGIPKARLREFGIDEDFIEMFKDTFELDGNTVKTFDSTKWSMKKQDKLGEVLRVMNQQVSPETTIGETGLYTRTTDLGRSISGLLTYPMGQFNQYGLNDLRHLDRGALMHSVGAFMGSYIGLTARYAIQDKQVSEEQKMLYSLLNIPQLGALTTLKSMLDPAAFGTAQNAANLVLPTELEVR